MINCPEICSNEETFTIEEPTYFKYINNILIISDKNSFQLANEISQIETSTCVIILSGGLLIKSEQYWRKCPLIRDCVSERLRYFDPKFIDRLDSSIRDDLRKQNWLSAAGTTISFRSLWDGGAQLKSSRPINVKARDNASAKHALSYGEIADD